MHVQVPDCLPRRLSQVEADVVAIGVVAPVEVGFELVEEFEQGQLFVPAGVEPGGDVASGDEERVAVGYGKLVADGEGEGVGRDPAGFGNFQERRGEHGQV